MFRARFVLAVMLPACSSGGDAPKPPPPPTSPPPIVADAGTDAEALQAADREGTLRPTSKRPGRPIEIVLRSSPVPARVSVDGAPLGVTPQVWIGETGAEHQYVFDAPGYASQTIRFVPITTGVLHPRLERVLEEADAGVAPPPEVVPSHKPAPVLEIDAPLAPLAPPPTVDTSPVPDAPAPPIGPTP